MHDLLKLHQEARPQWLLDEFGGRLGKGVTIGVVDSGWDYSIGDSNVLPGADFTKAEIDPNASRGLPQDTLGHGTMCTDLIMHVVPQAQFLPIRIFGAKYSTNYRTVVRAIDYAVDAGVSVLNLSLSTMEQDGLKMLYRACDHAVSRGVVIIASAFGTKNLAGGPAAFDNVISVGFAPLKQCLQFHYVIDEAIECLASTPAFAARSLGGHLVRVGPLVSFATATITGVVSLLRERYPLESHAEFRRHLARLAPLSVR